jgi:hypothetical protein
MLKTYRIIPFAFILFLFGFTLITVSPVNAQTPEMCTDLVTQEERPCLPHEILDKRIRETLGNYKADGEKFVRDSFKSGQLFEACGSLRQAGDVRLVRLFQRVQSAFSSYCDRVQRKISDASQIDCDVDLIGPHVRQGLVHQNNLLDAVYPVFCGWMDLKAKAPREPVQEVECEKDPEGECKIRKGFRF